MRKDDRHKSGLHQNQAGDGIIFPQIVYKKGAEMKPVDNLTLEEIDQKITRTAVEAAIEIGYYLKQIRDRKLYERAGCIYR